MSHVETWSLSAECDIVTVMPIESKWRLIAAPNPPIPPVTKATRFSNMVFSLGNDAYATKDGAQASAIKCLQVVLFCNHFRHGRSIPIDFNQSSANELSAGRK
jgi:hypothetical protein